MKRNAEPHRKWYRLARWQLIRQAVLTDHPLCVMCEADGKVTRATVCDHIVPHRGNEDLFWSGPFQALCAACHDGRKQRMEVRGYDTATGPDGWPLDPNHPANRPRT